MQNDLRVDFEADKSVVVINDSIRVTDGELSVMSYKDKTNGTIRIEGFLLTKYYEIDIRKLETARLVVDGINVCGEEFKFENGDKVKYIFDAESIYVKYQTEDFEEEQ